MTTIDQARSGSLSERSRMRPVFVETRRGVEPAGASTAEADAAAAAERAKAWRAIVAANLI